jgi:uncharacterized protein YdhG (YjbR/CyaY superfamily)
MDEKKTRPANIDGYIAQFPQDVQFILNKVRAVIHESAPEAEERISYGMPAFFLNGGLVWFAAYKKFIGFYPTTSGMNAFAKEIEAYRGTKSALHFPLDQEMPYELIRKIVKARVAENQRKAEE